MIANQRRHEAVRRKERKTEMQRLANPYASVFMSDKNRNLVEELIKEVSSSSHHRRTEIPILSESDKAIADEMVRLGFQFEDVSKAIDLCEAVTQKAVLDWLLLNLPESELPAAYDPRGKQFEVVKRSETKSIVSPLHKALRYIGHDNSNQRFRGIKQQSPEILLEEFFESYCVILKNLAGGNSMQWPRLQSSSIDSFEGDESLIEDELMALESIFENKEISKVLSSHSYRGHVLDQYILNLGQLDDAVPGRTEVFVVLVVSSNQFAKYPEQPALVMVKNNLLSDETLLSTSLEIMKYVNENLIGSPQLFDIWEYSRSLLEKTCKKNKQMDFSSLIRKVQSLELGDDGGGANGNETKRKAPKTKQRNKRQRGRDRTNEDKEYISAELLRRKQRNSTEKLYAQIQEYRTKLPAAKQKQEVLTAIRNNQVVLISGETGCGKTTQIPQFILDDYIQKSKGGHCQIVCTQPRRLAAIGVASRVSEEQGDREIGESVGYQIRLQSKVSKLTSLTFVTTGILLRRLHGDPDLSGISHVIVDEVHERNVDSDFLLCIIRKVLKRRPDLKLILMSATMDAKVFAEYFSTKSVIKIPGFTHPVQDYFLKSVLSQTKYMPPEHQIGKQLPNLFVEERTNDFYS